MSSSITFRDILATSALIADNFLSKIASYIELAPGGSIIVRYIKSSHKDDPFRTLLEITLVIFAIRYFTTSKYERKKRDFVSLSKNEVDQLIDDWEPEPLALPLSEKESWKLNAIPKIKTAITGHVSLISSDDVLINLASLNFLNFGVHPKVIKESKKIISQNGVGACGPPNFYGNQDIHIELEDQLKEFFGTEGAVLYGQDFTTAGSVLPSFLKRGDYVIADSKVNLSIQKALLLSRATIIYYNHNDLNHLELILQDLQDEVFKFEKPISRKFIVSEGLFANVGDYPDLPKLVELKNKFKFRLFLDESLSFGVLGKTGRGLTEFFGIDPNEVEIRIGSMANAFSSSGAFCIGDKVMCYHQRIGSLAYCFSASLPPYVAKATTTALQIIDESVVNGESSIIRSLSLKSKLFYDLIKKDTKLNKFVTIVSKPESSIIHLKLNDDLRSSLNFPISYTGAGSEVEKRSLKGKSDFFIESYNNEDKVLNKIIQDAINEGVLITKSTFSLAQEKLPIIPHLKIILNVDVSNEEIKTSFKTLKRSIEKNLKGLDIEGVENLEF